MKAATNMNGEFCKKLLKPILVALCALALVPSARAVNSLDNKVIYDFENQGSSPTVFDTTTSPDNGTFTAGAFATPTFSTAQAYQGVGSVLFSGSNPGDPSIATYGEQILITNNLNLSGDFEISMAIRPTALPGDEKVATLFAKGSNGENITGGALLLALYNTAGSTRLYYLHYNAGYSTIIGTGAVSTDVWQNVFLLHTNSTTEIFLNGASQGSVADSPFVSTNLSSHIGFFGASAGGEPGYQGYIDSFAFIPEPSTVALMCLGGLAFLRRRSVR